MGHRFAKIAFTTAVRAVQAAAGSRETYARMDEGDDYNLLLSEREADFISARDSFYMASVSETGWPYVQHRGGPAGFMKVLDARRIGFADYSGNRQYVSTGNFANDDRVALFFMDYPNRTRLKVLGRVQLIGLDDSHTLSLLEDDKYRASVERGMVITLEAFDWNCPQHITPRFNEAEVDAMIAPVLEENRQLKAARASARQVQLESPGAGELELVISGVRQLAPRVRAYEFRDPAGSVLPLVEAGAHLKVPVRLENGETVMRHYSIASNPARRDIYEIAVLREADGSGGSLAIHENYRIGMTVRMAAPENHFTLHADKRPAVLIAGGIGITPIKPMAQALAARGTVLQMHYAGHSLADMPFHDRLKREFGEQLTLYSSANGERLDVRAVLAAVPADAVFYVCGPARLIDAVIDAARAAGIDADRIHFERFEAGIVPDAKPVQVELVRSQVILQVGPEQTILDAMLAEGVEIAWSCKAGNCKSCAVAVIDGEPDHRDSALSGYERDEQHLMCPCVSRAKGDALVLDV
jgi:ferredoxin-NADP reductase/predicted pyridoxine 5'-phosphate oxidase superfamily flavin-nucleotide-binding protein